jgi:DNA excision repair protein ERCC-4
MIQSLRQRVTSTAANLTTAKTPEGRPVMVIDTREQDPLLFQNLASVRGTLYTGDYSIQGLEELFAIERKSIADLVACSIGENRERFERELHRLRGFRFKRLLIIGTPFAQIELQRYYSRIAPKAVLATLSAFEIRYHCPVVFAPTAIEAACQVERWALYFAREMTEIVNRMARPRVN